MTFIAGLILIGVAAAQSEDMRFGSDDLAGGFRPWSLHKVAELVTTRYEGRIISATIEPPRPHERHLGVQLVYEYRLVTPQQNLLNIRVSARDGAFLETSGRGQITARRPVVDDGTKLPHQGTN